MRKDSTERLIDAKGILDNLLFTRSQEMSAIINQEISVVRSIIFNVLVAENVYWWEEQKGENK